MNSIYKIKSAQKVTNKNCKGIFKMGNEKNYLCIEINGE